MQMKLYRLFSALAAAAFAFNVYAVDDVLGQFLAECRAPLGSEVELGVWNGDLDACKKVADENGIPMVAIWSNDGCAHCKILERAMLSDDFREWAKTCGMVLAFTCSLDPKGQRKGTDPGGSDTQIGTGTMSYKAFCKRPNGITSYPHVRFYWYENGKKIVDYSVIGDTVDNQTSKDPGSNPATYNKAGRVVIDYILNKSGFGAYTPKPLVKYAGGTVAVEETDGNRLEAEAGMENLSFEMVRTEKVAEIATNNVVKLIGPGGETVDTFVVDWAAGQTNQTVTIDISGVAFSENGQKALLVTADADGAEQGTNTVTYVTENSAENPLWIGERRATPTRDSKPVLEYGEWTMDLDVAREKVAAEEGDAYTLVAILGSLWCHDCANAARNFTSVKDGGGNNRLSDWAKAKNVALVTIDVPNFSTNSVECASPSLLSRKAYETQLAYEFPDYGMYDVSKGGAPESLAKRVLRSGLGYLTRKGVSDDRAAEVLERNWQLVSANTDEGGFHRPEDTNKFRTGVPIYVLLRKDGTVAARLTRFASKSPMADANWDNIIKRFDEMLEIAKDTGDHADPTEIENNDASTTTLSFRANGGSAYGEISHTDFQDVFKLEGVGGNALQKVTVDGASDAVVSVQFMKLNAEGKSEAVGTAATGKLSDGVALEETFAEAGDFFVKVSGGDIASGDFTVDSAKAGNFAAFTISGDVVLVPQQGKASGSAPEDSDKVVMRLEQGQMYRIEGVRPNAVSEVLEAKNEDPYCKFYTALVSGDVELTAAYGNGGTVTYQKWVPGKVGFIAEKKTVTESANEVKVALSRTDGRSGAVTVKVSMNEDATTLYDSDGAARFEFKDVEITFADDASGETNVTVKVFDDTRFDGNGDVVLKLELVSDENGDTVLTTTNYVLTVTEDDKQSAGKVAFTRADPFFSKKATVYAREDVGATVYAERIEASDGGVSAKISVTGGAKLTIGGEETDVVAWANHKSAAQAIKVTGIAAGKSASLTLVSPTDGLKVLNSSNKVTVVSVAADAPSFATDEDAATLYRYVATSNVYPVVLSAGAEGAKLTFTKLSGTLPAGLKAAWDAEENALAVFGATTAKAGVYPVVYQVTQQVGTTKTPGLTIELTYEVVDPTAASTDGAPYNAAVANGANGKGSQRTFKDLALLDIAGKRLAGILRVTVPQKGNVSAKLKCMDGDVAFSAKSWSGFSEGDRALVAELTSKKAGYSMTLEAGDDGGVVALVTVPGGADPLRAEGGGTPWSKTNPASTWAGYYTVALRNSGTIDEIVEGVAPRGHGYLTLTMNNTAAINSGTVKWAGMLPNGTKISGSAVLSGDEECTGTATLPVFAKSGSDMFSALMDVCATDGTVVEAEGIDSVWQHFDKYDEAGYGMLLAPYGGLYTATNANLSAICEVDYGTTEPVLSVAVDGLSGQMFAGTPSAIAPVLTTVATTLSKKGETQNKIAIKAGEANPQKLTLKFTPATGVVSGKFNLPYKDANGADKTLSADYAGVVIIGYGPGCGCGDEISNVILPFVVGGFYIKDKVSVPGVGGVSVRRGGAVSIDKLGD